MSCNNTIVQAIFSSGMLSINGVRATGIQFRMAASGCCATSVSNIVNIVVPACPPPPPPPSPPVGKCIPNVDLFGYTAIVAYDPTNCGGGHGCNRALFDLYLNDTFIGQANLNNGDSTNGPAGGPRSGVFTINDHIATNNLKIFLKCASPNNNCHQGIGRVTLISPLGQTIYAECLPNDTDVFTGDVCCISGLYSTGYEKNYGDRDSNWNIIALPTGINPPNSQSLPYSGYIYNPNVQNPTGFPAQWNSFSNILPNSKWIGAFESINSILQVPYSIIYSSNVYASNSGSYSLNVIAYADNIISGFLDGNIDYSNPNMPTITGGTPVIFDNNTDGLCSSSFTLSSGQHTLSFVVKDYGGSVGLLVGTSGCFKAGPIATLSTPTGYVTINSNSVNLNNVPNTDFPNGSYFQISQQEGNTNFVNSPSLVIKPLKVPLTIDFNNTNGGGCGTYTAKIIRYVGNNYWGGSLNTALIASYVNSPITNLPTENYSVSLTGMNESIKLFCTARDPITEGNCIGTSLSFNLNFS